MCEHKWVYFDTKKYYQYRDFLGLFTRIDKFYCEKCLEMKDVKKEDYSRETPEWY